MAKSYWQLFMANVHLVISQRYDEDDSHLMTIGIECCKSGCSSSFEGLKRFQKWQLDKIRLQVVNVGALSVHRSLEGLRELHIFSLSSP